MIFCLKYYNCGDVSHKLSYFSYVTWIYEVKQVINKEPVTFLQVTAPKGSTSNLHMKFDVGLPPDAVYNIVTDPDNKRVFENVKVSSE